MGELKFYTAKANAARRVKQLADEYPLAEWEPVESDDDWHVKATLSTDEALEYRGALEKLPIEVHVPTAAQKKAARDAARAAKAAAIDEPPDINLMYLNGIEQSNRR